MSDRSHTPLSKNFSRPTYLVDVPDEGRPALRTELSDLEGELPQSEEVTACGRPALTLRR